MAEKQACPAEEHPAWLQLVVGVGEAALLAHNVAGFGSQPGAWAIVRALARDTSHLIQAVQRAQALAPAPHSRRRKTRQRATRQPPSR